MSNAKMEIRNLTRDFPNMLLPKGSPVCPITKSTGMVDGKN